MKPLSIRLALFSALAAITIGGAFLAIRPSAPPLAVAGVDAGIEPWCAEGLTPIEGGGCFAAPASLTPPVPLLVYLHGRYSPKTLDDEHVRQARVARMGNAKGFAVLAMRGTQGECTQEELADTWCWPSNPRNVEHGAAFFARIAPSIAAARARIGAGPTNLLGFSNGAYFAALIATRSFGPFDAIAIAHGGPVQPTHAMGTMPPLLLITADDDPSDGEMRQLDAELGRERWPHELVAREGGHALPEWDVEMATTFFRRARTERLPLAPPLARSVRIEPLDAAVVGAEDAAMVGAEDAAELPGKNKEPETAADDDSGGV